MKYLRKHAFGILFPIVALSTINCAAVASAARVEADAPVVSLNDIYDLARLRLQSLSPNGEYAILSVTHGDVDNDNRRKSSITYLVKTRTAERQELPFSANSFWSRASDRISWVDESGVSTEGVGTALLKSISIAAPNKVAEGVSFKTAPGAHDFAVSPDRRWVAMLAADITSRKPEGKFDKSFEVFDINQSAMAKRGVEPNTRIWIAAVGREEAPRELTPATEHVEGFAWMPGSLEIAYYSRPGSQLSAVREISLKGVSIANGDLRTIVPSPTRMSGAPQVSSNGTIAYQSWRGRDPYTHAVQITAVLGSRPRILSESIDRQVLNFRWLGDGKTMLVAAVDRDQAAAWTLDLSGKARKIDFGPAIPASVIVSFNPPDIFMSDNGAVAFLGGVNTARPELWFKSSPEAKPRRLTHITEETPRSLGRSDSVVWWNDGFEHVGLLTYPVGFDARQRYPLLLDIHGGPEIASSAGYNGHVQYFAGRGWLVFQPNYRGSTNMGERYQAAVIGDLAQGPMRDIIAGLNVVKAKNIVDERRVAITGGSYGAYLTAYLIGNYNFCAATPMSGPVDWAQYYSTSGFAIWLEEVAGSPWKASNRETYQRASAFELIPRVKTPTLIMHGADDPNGPVLFAYEYFHGLRENGVPTRLIVYSDTGHGAGDPWNDRDHVRRQTEWQEQYCH